jgi:hypothetical protein
LSIRLSAYCLTETGFESVAERLRRGEADAARRRRWRRRLMRRRRRARVRGEGGLDDLEASLLSGDEEGG